ncbi:unnamed protein product [Aphis gossypii]|uniref:Uncharacterized protein n=1 Tax=Aphis gossypii TaxID=80765 RepID=A0A9P0IM02_APHGO|nr:unnamed protein product [Aphis gossypii]
MRARASVCCVAAARGGIRFLARFPQRRRSPSGWWGMPVDAAEFRGRAQQLFPMSGKRFERRLPPRGPRAIGRATATAHGSSQPIGRTPPPPAPLTRTASVPRRARPSPPRAASTVGPRKQRLRRDVTPREKKTVSTRSKSSSRGNVK